MSGPVGEIAVVATDSAGVRMVSISGSLDSLPEWSLSETALTEIRGNDPPYLGRVGEVAFFGDEQLLVVDVQTAQLRVFSADGRESKLLGGKGDGPGEFERIKQLSVTPGDTVYVWEYPRFRLSVFDPDGALATTMPMADATIGRGTFLLDVWALGSDRFLLFGNYFDDREGDDATGATRRGTRDGVVAVIASDGTARASSVRIPGRLTLFAPRSYIASSPFSNQPFVTANRDRILYGSGRNYELVLRDFDLRPLTVIRWAGWEQPLTESLLDATRASLQASIDALPDLMPNVPPGVIETNNRMLDDFFRPELRPDSLPAVRSVLLDEDGRIWVARFQIHEDFFGAISGSDEHWDQQDVWHVLDPDGTPIARVRLPPDTQLRAVRRDRALVVTRDELDVESVRVLTIEP